MPSHPPPTGATGRLGATCARHPAWTIGAWLLAVAVAVVALMPLAGPSTANFDTPGTDSARANALLADHFADHGAWTIDLAWSDPAGAEATRPQVEALVVAAADLEGLGGAAGTEISADGRVGVARIAITAPSPDDLPAASIRTLAAEAGALESRHQGLVVALGGDAVTEALGQQTDPELVGMLMALAVLVLTFGSLVAAGLPIISALTATVVVSALIGLAARVIDMPDFATPVAMMIGIGVGIDYALLLVARQRAELAAGHPPLRAVEIASGTAGHAVVVAAGTVIVALLGLTLVGLSYMTAVALAGALAVAVAAAAAITLMPALLALLGTRIDRLRVRPAAPRRTGLSGAWARAIARRPGAILAGGLALLVLLTLPIATLRTGFPDAGNDPAGTSTRQAYDLIASGFGPGANGPLAVVAEPTGPGDGVALVDRLRAIDGVAATAGPITSPDGRAILAVVTPAGAPQSPEVERLVHTIRAELADPLPGRSVGPPGVGGATAAAIDASAHMSGRLPWVVGAVSVVAVLLLWAAFRAPVVAAVSALVNLLSIGAAYGVVALVAQGGAVGGLVGIDAPVPVPPFTPVMMFAILFGLSMDYQVFLLSRIREFHLRHGDARRAVGRGLVATGTVISAAAAIMIAVFAAFALSADVFMTLFAVGMAVAILIDATVVRQLVMPALLHLLGERAWGPLFRRRADATVEVAS